MALLPLCRAQLARRVLPLAVAVDASGGEAGGNGGYGVVITGKPEDEIREELRWAERRGSYQRLTPGKIRGELWASTLAAVGLEEEKQGDVRSETFARRPCERCPSRAA